MASKKNVLNSTQNKNKNINSSIPAQSKKSKKKIQFVMDNDDTFSSSSIGTSVHLTTESEQNKKSKDSIKTED